MWVMLSNLKGKTHSTSALGPLTVLHFEAASFSVGREKKRAMERQ